MNIVDLGLVYDVTVSADGVHVLMTTTSPACPVGELIADEAAAAQIKDSVAAVVAKFASPLTGAAEVCGFTGLGGRLDRRKLLAYAPSHRYIV